MKYLLVAYLTALGAGLSVAFAARIAWPIVKKIFWL